MPSLKTITTAAFIALTGATSIYAQSETTVDLDVFSSLLSSIAVPEDLPTAAQDIVTDATSVESIPTFTQPNIPTFTRPIFTVRTFTLPTAAPITTPVSPVPQCSDPKTLTCAKAVVGEALALPPACIDEIQRFNLNRTSSSSSQPGLPFTLSANSTSNIPQVSKCMLLVFWVLSWV
ncbi:hypothetical protein BC829DRAFT_491988 [Chytridium lagenaria]|nr:hypothetical protein BC829DRAFT_491988 [Chytridium lagenaria]